MRSMPLRGGHQLGKMLVQHAWKVLAAFSIGVVAIIGGGLFLSDVHRIPQTTRSSRGSTGTGTVFIQNEVAEQPPENAGNEETASSPENPRRSRRKKTSSSRITATVPRQDVASAPSIGPGPDIATQSVLREPAQLASVLAAASPTLAADTPITIRLAQQVSAKENHKGDVFKATLAAPLVANGIVVAKAGAPVRGRIVDARSARLFRGGSNLNLELTDVQTASGGHLRLKTTQWYETGSHSILANVAIIPSEAAKKAVSGVVSGAKAGGEDSDSSERTVAAKSADPGEKSEKSKGSVVLSPGSEIVFRLLEPTPVTGTPEAR
jgi:hypothetical protein